jgi:hypothetical protein
MEEEEEEDIIDSVGAMKLFEALKVNTTLTALDFSGNKTCFNSFFHNTDNWVENEAAVELSTHSNQIHHSFHSISRNRLVFHFILTTHKE